MYFVEDNLISDATLLLHDKTIHKFDWSALKLRIIMNFYMAGDL